jgi:hypothetical protein
MNGFKFMVSTRTKKVFVSKKAEYTKEDVKRTNRIDKCIKGLYYTWVKPSKLIDVIAIYKKDGYKIQ